MFEQEQNLIVEVMVEERTVALLQDLETMGEVTCTKCSSAICGHEYVINAIMGFKNAPRCVPCLSVILGWNPKKFLHQVLDHIERRACFNAGWQWSSRNEGSRNEKHPECLWKLDEKGEIPMFDNAGTPVSSPDNSLVPDADWNAGDMGCGDLVLELRIRLNAMKPGAVLAVTARDLGAPEDLPAWCSLTGNKLVFADHPLYLIQRKEH